MKQTKSFVLMKTWEKPMKYCILSPEVMKIEKPDPKLYSSETGPVAITNIDKLLT